MNIVMIVISEDSLELWIQVRPVQETQAYQILVTFHCLMSSTLGYLVTQKMPGTYTSIVYHPLWFDSCIFSLLTVKSEWSSEEPGLENIPISVDITSSDGLLTFQTAKTS